VPLGGFAERRFYKPHFVVAADEKPKRSSRRSVHISAPDNRAALRKVFKRNV
jgi:hypothetical protein